MCPFLTAYTEMIRTRTGWSAAPAAAAARLRASPSFFCFGGAKKNAAQMRGVFRSSRPALLGNRPLEHPVDLLVGGVAARLAGMSRRQRLVGRALRTAGGLARRLGGAVGLIRFALGSGDVALSLRQLGLEIRYVSLEGLQVGATC